MYTDITSNRKIYLQFKSIKRSFYLLNVFNIFKISFFIFVICAVVKFLNEINVVKEIAFKSEQSQNKLCDNILQYMKDTNKNYHNYIHQYITSTCSSERITNIKVEVFHKNENVEIEYVPACRKYENVLKTLYHSNNIPNIYNIFMFYGDHGLGKTYSAYQLARILSKNINVILLSISMEPFLSHNDINSVIVILKKIELKLKKFEGNYKIIWLFEELDIFLKNYISTNNLKKTITEFIESAGFIDGKNKILMFTMNNGDMFKHNYWTQNFKDTHTKCNNTLHICVDFKKALEYTNMDIKNFLIQGELNRLYAFMNGYIFRYRNLNITEAVNFAHKYQLQQYNDNNFTCIDNEINLFDKYNLQFIISNIRSCVNF